VKRIRLGPGSEFDMIRRFLSAGPGGALPEAIRVGPGDDCAVIGGGDLAISNDLSIEDVHFRRDWLEPEEIGYRAAAGALSDLAAVAARPVGVLAALALHRRDADVMAQAIMDGVRGAAADAGAALIGGDTSRSPGPVVLDIIVVGTASSPVLRDGAKVGDGVWVTGELGAAAAAVRAWESGALPRPDARAAFARPQPRLREACWLAERMVIHALIDISDGLVGDAGHIAAASGVHIAIDSTTIPVHPAVGASGGGHSRLLASQGGEDYELCFTADDAAVLAVANDFTARFGVALSRVGVVNEGTGVSMDGRDGAAGGGYDHFAGGEA
jgi:thiamine-monophosphate kinase